MILFIVTFFSFVLDFVFNYYFNNSLFSSLIILTSLILLRSIFKDCRGYYFYCFFVGFLYDYLYTGNYFMNSGMFLIVGFFINYVFLNMRFNIFVSIISIFLSIILYRVFCFLFLFFNGIVGFSFDYLLKSIYCSFLINIIYGILMYYFLYFMCKKFNVKRIN